MIDQPKQEPEQSTVPTCPKCGSELSQMRFLHRPGDDEGSYFRQCSACGWKGPSADTAPDAERLWAEAPSEAELDEADAGLVPAGFVRMGGWYLNSCPSGRIIRYGWFGDDLRIYTVEQDWHYFETDARPGCSIALAKLSAEIARAQEPAPDVGQRLDRLEGRAESAEAWAHEHCAADDEAYNAFGDLLTSVTERLEALEALSSTTFPVVETTPGPNDPEHGNIGHRTFEAGPAEAGNTTG